MDIEVWLDSSFYGTGVNGSCQACARCANALDQRRCVLPQADQRCTCELRSCRRLACTSQQPMHEKPVAWFTEVQSFEILKSGKPSGGRRCWCGWKRHGCLLPHISYEIRSAAGLHHLQLTFAVLYHIAIRPSCDGSL